MKKQGYPTFSRRSGLVFVVHRTARDVQRTKKQGRHAPQNGSFHHPRALSLNAEYSFHEATPFRWHIFELRFRKRLESEL